MYSSYNYRYLDYTIFCTKPLRYTFYISYHISYLFAYSMFTCMFHVKRKPSIFHISHTTYIFWQMLWASQWPPHSGALHLFSLITMHSAQSYTFPSHPKTQIEARLASTDSLHSLLLFSLSHQANPSSNSCPLVSRMLTSLLTKTKQDHRCQQRFSQSRS